ncbi:FHA domain-containing protein [Chamaesiphon sp. VAR_48_metabat_135_sub]|uniref:FHA domain-containing protein n=1 Tax=Chamaesiphon sp. VAR_48_metabat_135_sub TaxID=2964699 RepID=UPI00286D3891|nr:FHA domain-containing protein [Chamaesiphon sp. VAR_48_metabat_135_sub]
MSAIVLSLINSVPVQNWTFLSENIIRIGRATDNHVVLFSAVVSRHHAELRWSEISGWEIFNLSANGTYVDGEAIKTVAVADGMIIRLATSGPKIQIKSDVESEKLKC